MKIYRRLAWLSLAAIICLFFIFFVPQLGQMSYSTASYMVFVAWFFEVIGLCWDKIKAIRSRTEENEERVE